MVAGTLGCRQQAWLKRVKYLEDGCGSLEQTSSLVKEWRISGKVVVVEGTFGDRQQAWI